MADPLKMTEATALALHAVVEIAARNRVTTTAQIAESLSASPAHLAKVLHSLVRAGWLTAMRGPSGGYRLAKKPEMITLGQLYQSLEGTPRIDGCLFSAPVCRQTGCIMGQAVQEARRDLWEYLEKTSIRDLAESETQGEAR